MDRLLEHFEADTNLRGEVCGQESFDEFHCRVIEDEEAASRYGVILELQDFDFSKIDDLIRSDWRTSLHPETRYCEVLYLLGWVDKAVRSAIMSQGGATLVEAWNSAGS
jgi:hypothetical protein